MGIRLPLNSTATRQADDVFYCRYSEHGNRHDWRIFTESEERIPLDAEGTEGSDEYHQDDQRAEWIQLYEDILAHNEDGSRPFPNCPNPGHIHHPEDCPHCEEPEDDPDDDDEDDDDDPPNNDDPIGPVDDCERTNLHVQVLDATTGAPLQDIEIAAGAAGTKQSDEHGWAKWRPITPGTYDVSARKVLHTPDPAERDDVSVPAGTTVEVELRLQPFDLHLHVDANRDGQVDDNWTNNTPWEAGAGKFGAVVLVNNDNDNNDPFNIRDNRNRHVDGPRDVSDIAPLEIRRHPAGVTLPRNVSAELRVSDRDKLRIFKSERPRAREALGPGHRRFRLRRRHLDDAVIPLGMEAVEYPDRIDQGKITLYLDIRVDGAVVRTEEAEVRIAPWMAYNHLQKSVKVHVLDCRDNVSFIGDLRGAVTGAGVTLVDGGGHGGDRWMQDVMEPGFSTMPRRSGATRDWHLPQTLRALRTRAAEHYPKREMLGINHGLAEPGDPVSSADTMNSFGNLECSPPFTHGDTGREYKFGRIIHGGNDDPLRGRQMLRIAINFLEAQTVQEPLQIDTSWLVVGHVDEIISFLPASGGSHGYKVAIASTERAMDSINAAPDSAPMLQGYRPPDARIEGHRPTDIEAYLNTSKYSHHTAKAFRDDAAMVAVQGVVQGHLNGVKTRLKTGLDLEDSDFIEFPVLFEQPDTDVDEFIAYTAGSVNMLVLTASPSSVELCVPKPFGPTDGGRCAFETKILSELSSIGIGASKVHFIDDFSAYHWLQGEIHCGTNSEREAPDGVWWWEMDWV